MLEGIVNTFETLIEDLTLANESIKHLDTVIQAMASVIKTNQAKLDAMQVQLREKDNTIAVLNGILANTCKCNNNNI